MFCAPFITHMFAWAHYSGLTLMKIPAIPAGPPMPTEARIGHIMAYRPTILLGTPTYMIYLGETMKLDLTGGLGLGSQSYISGYYAGMLSVPDTDIDASMTDFFVRAELPFHPIPFLSIIPSAAYTSLLGDAEKALDNDEMLYSGKKDNVVWGLSALFSF